MAEATVARFTVQLSAFGFNVCDGETGQCWFSNHARYRAQVEADRRNVTHARAVVATDHTGAMIASVPRNARLTRREDGFFDVH